MQIKLTIIIFKLGHDYYKHIYFMFWFWDATINIAQYIRKLDLNLSKNLYIFLIQFITRGVINHFNKMIDIFMIKLILKFQSSLTYYFWIAITRLA